ncbi:MAG TPA: DNA double-strand break repair nuclease NurA [Chloroflexia bacterium]|jgi:hypothetical protein
MPFDAAEVARQIEQSRSGVQAEMDARADALELAVRIYKNVGETEWEQRVQDASARRWVASPLSPLKLASPHTACAPDYSVVATDSSFVAPDKHRGALCHLINVGRVMIRYGNNRAAEIDNVPNHYTDMLLDGEEAMSARLLAAKCALRELQELYEWARRYGADLALLDGSLMQLVLVLAKEEYVQSLMSEYFQTLRAFEGISVPVVGYISQPASQMVMRAIRMLACDQPTPCEKKPAEQCGCQSLWNIDDADLFWEILDVGHASPIFEPVFSYMVGENAQQFKELVFSYIATEYEIVRLEYPIWLPDKGVLDRAISIMLHQCKLGQGYPNSLTLAHQFAALHNNDRESYYFLLERAGLMRKPTEKAHGKRLIGQAI